MFVTVFVTKWFTQQEPLKQEAPKPMFQFTARPPQEPSKIPTLSLEKHTEFVQMMAQWNENTTKARVNRRKELEKSDSMSEELATMCAQDEHDAAVKARLIPESRDIYSETLSAKECMFCIRKSVSVGEWAAFERQNATAPIGSWIPMQETDLFSKEEIRVTFAILRVDRPERWERHTYFYRQKEKIPREEVVILSEGSMAEARAVHDAAMAKGRHPDREYIYSTSMQPHERVPCYRVKTVDEWWDFERKNADAPIGSWIHFDNPAVLSPSNICVTCAIVRIDAPERWEERVYFYHKGEPIPKQ